MTTQMINEVRGYSLFNDVEDVAVRVYNQARSLKNIILDNSDKNKVVSTAGQHIMFKYFENIPEEDRGSVHLKLKELIMVKEVE